MWNRFLSVFERFQIGYKFFYNYDFIKTFFINQKELEIAL